MKAPLLCLGFALSAGSVLASAELQRGASREEVRATLGVPSGQLLLGGRQVLYFERGEVELQNGSVTRVNLRSLEEHAILTAREQRMREDRDTRRAQSVAEGTALRDRKLADPTFLSAPVSYQVIFWEDFARRYPAVSCAEPLMIVRLRFNEQQEERRRSDERADRLAEREERFAVEHQPVIYPLYTSSRRSRGHHHDQSFGLEPITYTFFDKTLPVYTSPSGNPAGSLSSGLFDPSVRNPAGQNRGDRERSRRDCEDYSRRSHGRGAAGGSGRFRERT